MGPKPARRRLLVLGAGAGQLGLLAAARELGLFVIAVDRDPGAPGFAYADRRALLPLASEPLLVRLAQAERVDGVIAPGLDFPVGTAARIAARLGLPHPLSPRVAAVASSTLRRRERLTQAGVPQATGKHEGPEVRVAAFSLGGVFAALTVAERVPEGLLWPSARARPAVELAGRAAAALEIEEGPTSTRIRLTPEGPRVLALAARLGGAHDAELCRAAVGVDLNALALSAAVGEEVDPARLVGTPRSGGACIHFLPWPARRPVEDAEGVEQVWLYRASGRGGAVLATGASREQALARAARAAECIRFGPFDAEAVA